MDNDTTATTKGDETESGIAGNTAEPVTLGDKDLAEAQALNALHLRAAEASEVRVALGRRLIAARPRWGKSGKAARGWDAFLAAAGIEKRSAQRYVAAARRADGIRDSVSRKRKSSPVERALALFRKLSEDERREFLDVISAARAAADAALEA